MSMAPREDAKPCQSLVPLLHPDRLDGDISLTAVDTSCPPPLLAPLYSEGGVTVKAFEVITLLPQITGKT